MFSYGSGLSSTMFSFRLRDGQYPFTLSNIAGVLNVSEKLDSRHVVRLISLFLLYENASLQFSSLGLFFFSFSFYFFIFLNG